MSTISRANVAITDLPWLQKYRPATFDDIVGNEHSINILKNVAKKGNIPNFLLSGPPGTGKTSSIVCLANELYGKELAKRAILELNASDERSVNVIRDKVKAFAQTKVTLPPGLQKFVILDEVDSMVDPAQKALRAIMEQYSDTTRFALACNNEDKIDEAIMSRITKLSFTNLSQEEVALRLLYIIKQENIKYTPEGLQAIIFTADGDMRQAINNLQSTYSGFGMIDEENVYKVCDVPDPKYIMEMLKRCIRYEVKNVFNAVVKLYGDGYSALDIVQTMMKLMKSASENEIEEDYYNDFLMEIAKTELVIKSGTDSELQVIGLIQIGEKEVYNCLSTKKAFLEIEENDCASKKIVDLLNESITSKNPTKRELKTFPLKPPELLSRIANFLPQIALDNKELEKKDVKSIDIENVEGAEKIIEMNLGLGIFEQIKKPSECDIIINPKESTFDNSTKPKIIMNDNETKNGRGELSNEISQKSNSYIIFKDDLDDENLESSNIIMDIQSSLNCKKKPKIIVLDDNQSNEVKETMSLGSNAK
ncbi:unnamed protein product [Rhizophagus irregularis]|nr:unnamed protein product [Rhizophagus irregularis]